MADLDDLRDGCNFGLDQAVANQTFHVKGAGNLPWGMKDRLSRIFNPATGRTVMLACDHGFIMGPTSGLERIDLNIVPLIEYADLSDVYPWCFAVCYSTHHKQINLLAFGCRYLHFDRIE